MSRLGSLVGFVSSVSSVSSVSRLSSLVGVREIKFSPQIDFFYRTNKILAFLFL